MKPDMKTYRESYLGKRIQGKLLLINGFSIETGKVSKNWLGNERGEKCSREMGHHA